MPLIDISVSSRCKPAFSAGEFFSIWQITYGGGALPLSANPAVRSADGCKIQTRVPGGKFDWAGDDVGGAGAGCLPDDDDEDEGIRAVLVCSFDGRITLDSCWSAVTKKKQWCK